MHWWHCLARWSMIKINNHIIYIFWLIYFYYLFPFGNRTPGVVFCILSKSGLAFFFYSDHFWYGGKIVHVDTKVWKKYEKNPLFDKDLLIKYLHLATIFVRGLSGRSSRIFCICQKMLSSIFRNNRFAFNKIFQRSSKKFAILNVHKKTHLVFSYFSFVQFFSIMHTNECPWSMLLT